MRGAELARNEEVRARQREEVLDHVVVGTPNGPEYWELVFWDADQWGDWRAGYAIKRYGGAVPWSLFERHSFGTKRAATHCWLEATGDREAS